MSPRVLSTLLACGLGALGLAGAAHAQSGAEAAGEMTLHHPLRWSSNEAGVTLSVELSPQAWQVGGPQGPVASAAQLRDMLGRLAGIELYGRCKPNNGIAKPCVLPLAAPELACIARSTWSIACAS